MSQEHSLESRQVSVRARPRVVVSGAVLLAGLVLLTGLVPLAGCGERDQIRRYQAPKLASMPATAAAAPAHAPLDAQQPQRMLAAIVPHEGQAWFFKVTGTPGAIAEHAAAFKQLLKSIRFEQGKPLWQLPDGWQQQPASEMRFATLRLGAGDKALEMSVIPLPTSAGDQTQNILANVNRWRDQLRLPPITAEQLPESTETIELDGATATMVDLVNGTGSTREAADAGAAAADAGGPADSAAGGEGIEFQTPEGWTPTPLVVSRGGITLRHEAAFEVVSGGQRAEFTLDRLPPGAGLLQNVNRWRGQIGLESITAEQLAAAVGKLDIDGVDAALVELVGDREAILGIEARQGGQAWYFKLKGDKELVMREKERFLAFARSVRFP